MNKDILRLAIPNILSNISIPLMSTVDVALMGKLSVIHLGAIGLATMIFNFFFWNFGFLRMGTTGLVAQAYGGAQKEQVNQILSKGVYLAISIAIVIIILQIPIGYLANYALGISSEHSPLVWTYFNIRIWSAPATLVTYVLFGWLFGMQDAFTPMVVTIFINLLNIVCSYYMVVILKWEITGAAYGTLLAEYTGVLILSFSILYRYGMRLIHPIRLHNWSRFLTVNRDLFIRTIALTTAFAIFYRQSAQSGELILATNVIMLQFLSWTSYGIDGFSFASESLVGRYFGSKNKIFLKKAISYSFKWALGLSAMLSILFGIFGKRIGFLFTDDNQVLTLLISYIPWLVVLPFLVFSCYIWDGIFIGLTKTDKMRDSMLISILCYIIIYAILRTHVANAIWVAFAAFLTLRGLILTVFWVNIRRQIL